MNFLQILIVNLQRVTIGSVQHVLPIILAVLFCVILFRFAKKAYQKQKERIFGMLGIFVSLTIIAFHSYKISLGNYNVSTDLPLFLCSFLALIIPVFTQYKKYWMYEVLLFWIIAGTSQGVITPDIAEGFPSLDYFRYWIVHLGLLIIVFYATIVLRMRPKLKSVFKSFLALQIYMFLLMGVNYLLDANYSYLNQKPESASALDYFGDWPTYLFVVEALLLPFFLLIYFPFYWIKKK
ncbi:TIGR02206 family membrane protein [Lacinutrix sp. C3R15]|uniref:YwaF family protein n=1 Tax=Flavobacteriaceae TaxID=49546 RepID=UPI001C09A758|nr:MULTISPECIES: TIGR02206 family membrane protein [Flavobacteriaceae]MBU2941010.1 TIGR02206 family membrane protein [Lacinutrix sp. C3R15]MDO6624329.1 TIGR02206 family membrane protein [Oceanihabitans sp. 1_MG-2023]